MTTAQLVWKREYSKARYLNRVFPAQVDPVRFAAFNVLRMGFGPVFPRVFSATFDRRAAAAAVPWWLAGGAPTPVAVYQPKGAASLAASYVNLVNPGTYDAALGTAPTLDASGWVFVTASSQWLDTTIVMQTGYSSLVRFSGATNGLRYAIGSYSASPDKFYQIGPDLTFLGTTAVMFGAGAYVQRTPVLAGGVLAIAGQQPYRDGAADGAVIAAGSGFPAYSLTIGVRNGASRFGYFSGSVQAVAIWETSTGHATWMPAVSAAVALI